MRRLRLDRSKIGQSLPPLRYDVERGQLRWFSTVIGETDPIYLDEAAARAAGYRSIVAPPTFGFSCLRGSAAQLPIAAALGLSEEEIGQSLHGEQSFEYGVAICGGDRITMVETIVDIFEKRRGELQMVSSRTRLTNQLGECAGCMAMVLVFVAARDAA